MLDLKIKEGHVIVTSKDIADSFGKEHKEVLRIIKNLSCSDKFRGWNYTPSTYISIQNKELPCFDITRDGFAFLAMGFTGPKASAFKETYIIEFNRMETTLLHAAKSNSIEDISGMLKGIEDLNEIGSIHGKGLADYANKKKAEVLKFEKAVSKAQLTFKM